MSSNGFIITHYVTTQLGDVYDTVFDCMCLYYAYISMHVTILDCKCQEFGMYVIVLDCV